MTRSTPRTVALVALVVVVALLALHPGDDLRQFRRAVGLAPERLLPAPEVPARGGAYSFALTQRDDTEPATWDPCSPVRYQVNPEGEPPGGRQLVERAIARASRASGLAFEDEGDTDQRPQLDGGGAHLFGRSDPVVIGWATEREYAELAGPVAGVGGAAAEADRSGHLWLVSGGVALDREALTPAVVAQRPRVAEGIVLHEVGHVVGLGHVDEPMELMFTDNTGQVELGPGDSEGFARLGSVDCR